MSFVEPLDTEQLEGFFGYLIDDSLSLAEHHREHFELTSDEAVAFNKDQRIVIVGQKVTNEIRQTASFLRAKGVRVTCVEFSFFPSNGGARAFSPKTLWWDGSPPNLTVLPPVHCRSYLKTTSCGR